jgi:hypothetical protein
MFVWSNIGNTIEEEMYVFFEKFYLYVAGKTPDKTILLRYQVEFWR